MALARAAAAAAAAASGRTEADVIREGIAHVTTASRPAPAIPLFDTGQPDLAERADELLSAIDASQRHHDRAARALSGHLGPLLVSPFVLAELDYLLGHRVGPHAQWALLSEVASGAYRLEPFTAIDLARAADVIEQYADLQLGIADASIVVLSERHEAVEVLTLDDRHFRALAGPLGRPFRLLPANA